MLTLIRDPEDPSLYWLGVTGALLILILVLPVLFTKSPCSTSINNCIKLDCLLRLCNIPIILFVAGVIEGQFCSFRVIYAFSMTLLTHLLSVCMAFYRWVFVCHPDAVFTVHQRSSLDSLLAACYSITALSLISGAFIYRGHSIFIVNCENR